MSGLEIATIPSIERRSLYLEIIHRFFIRPVPDNELFFHRNSAYHFEVFYTPDCLDHVARLSGIFTFIPIIKPNDIG